MCAPHMLQDMVGVGSLIEPNEVAVVPDGHHEEVDFGAVPRRDQAPVVVVEVRVCRLCVCMYVYVCMYVCMYVCVCLCVCLHVCACVSLHVCACECACVYMCVYVCVCVCVCVRKRGYVTVRIHSLRMCGCWMV